MRSQNEIAAPACRKRPLSVRVAVLLRKQGRQQVAFEPDFCGFAIPDAFVIGYGLDYNDEYRNLPYVAVLPDDVQSSTQFPKRHGLDAR